MLKLDLKSNLQPEASPERAPEHGRLPGADGKDDLLKAMGASESIPSMASVNPLGLNNEPDGRQIPQQRELVVNGRAISYSTQLAGQGPELAALSDIKNIAGISLQGKSFSQYSSEPELVDQKGYIEGNFKPETSFVLNGRNVQISQSEPERSEKRRVGKECRSLLWPYH